MGQSRGKETILECKVTAFPQGVTVWRYQGQDLINSDKYRVEVYQDRGHMVILSVRIVNLTREDFGQYSCFASNGFGMDEETMTLYGKKSKKVTDLTLINVGYFTLTLYNKTLL